MPWTYPKSQPSRGTTLLVVSLHVVELLLLVLEAGGLFPPPFFLLLKTCSPSLCLVCFVNFTRTLKGLGSTSDASRLPLLLAPYQSFLISVSLLPSSSFIYNALTATPSGPAGLAATASILLVQCRGVALPSLRLSFEASPLLLFLLHILCVLMIDYWLLLLSSTRKSISIGYVTSCIFVCSVSRDTRSPS